jgi:uncharacterized protein
MDHRKINSKLEIRDTKKYGNGVFATKDIAKDSIMCVLRGERMDVKELVNRVNSDKEYIDDPLQIGKRTYIDLDKNSRCFNHSCSPNAGLRKASEMFALSDIKKGEEVTFDYSLTIAPTVWSMKCKCGSKNCRKILGDILTVPKSELKRYRAAGALQSYMKLLLKEIGSGNYRIPKYEIIALEGLKK